MNVKWHVEQNSCATKSRRSSRPICDQAKWKNWKRNARYSTTLNDCVNCVRWCTDQSKVEIREMISSLHLIYSVKRLRLSMNFLDSTRISRNMKPTSQKQFFDWRTSQQALAATKATLKT